MCDLHQSHKGRALRSNSAHWRRRPPATRLCEKAALKLGKGGRVFTTATRLREKAALNLGQGVTRTATRLCDQAAGNLSQMRPQRGRDQTQARGLRSTQVLMTTRASHVCGLPKTSRAQARVARHDASVLMSQLWHTLVGSLRDAVTR